METLTDVLAWLTGPAAGSFLVVAWFASWYFEKKTWFQNLAGETRAFIIVALAALLGIGAQVLAGFPDVVALITPYFQPVMYALVAWLGTQVAHAGNPFKS